MIYCQYHLQCVCVCERERLLKIHGKGDTDANTSASIICMVQPTGYAQCDEFIDKQAFLNIRHNGISYGYCEDDQITYNG